MKKLFLLFVAILGLATTVSAQKFGRVQTGVIMESLPATDSLKIKLQAYEKEMQEQGEVMYVEYNKKIEEYEANKATLSSIMLKQKESELQDAGRRLQEFQTEMQKEAEAVQNALVTPIYNTILASVKKIAKAAGITMVIEDGMANQIGTPYPFLDVDLITDITPLVIKDLGGKAQPAK